MSKDNETEVKVYESFAEEVWDKLSRISVLTHAGWLPKTDKRPAISYLPWHKAWMLLKREFPASTYTHSNDLRHPDESVEVEVKVCIKKNQATNDGYVFTNARLAVMDQWFNPIKNPTARQVNDSRQRVLVKALAFAGLGLDLWSEDTVPVGTLGDPIDEEQVALLKELVDKTESDEEKFLNWCGCETFEELPIERFKSARGLLEAKLIRQQKVKAK
jgi:hypothetical protein